MDVGAIEQRLAARAAEPPPESWKHEQPGDQIIGRFRRLERGTTSYGDCWIVVLESLRVPGRLASVWLFNTTLLNEFKRVRPRAGEVVLVRYEGRVDKPGQNAYHLWKVVVDRDGAESPYSWADVDGLPDEPSPGELEAGARSGQPSAGDYFDREQPTTAAASGHFDEIPF